MNKFSPFAIPNHSPPISMSMQSLKKINKKNAKNVRDQKQNADGRTLVWFGEYNIIARHFLRGIKMGKTVFFLFAENGLKSYSMKCFLYVSVKEVKLGWLTMATQHDLLI